MAIQLTGTVLHLRRAFGRVRFTATWANGEATTITVPKSQFDATIRKGDTVATIIPSPTYTAEDLMRWNAPRRDDSPPEPTPVANITPEIPPDQRHYHRIGGPTGR